MKWPAELGRRGWTDPGCTHPPPLFLPLEGLAFATLDTRGYDSSYQALTRSPNLSEYTRTPSTCVIATRLRDISGTCMRPIGSGGWWERSVLTAVPNHCAVG